jgi:putative zinc finger/helix-turn-helix YgiT family protein
MNESLQFPRMCPTCCKKTVQPVTIEHVAEVKYESRTYSVEIPDLKVGKCSVCEEVYFDLDTDAQIDAAFRRKLQLLTAEQIRTGRKRLGMKQEEFANALDIAKATINRWENRKLIPSRVMNKLLKAFFRSKPFRDLLATIDADPSIGVDEVEVTPVVVESEVTLTATVGTASPPPEDDDYGPLPVNRVAFHFRKLDPGMNAFLAQMDPRDTVLPLMN